VSAHALPPEPNLACADHPGGVLVLRAAQRDVRLQYYLYVPRNLPQVPWLLVAIHGISRNAREHGHALANEAERRGAILVVPKFTSEFYPDFQRLGIATHQYADVALDRIVADVEGIVRLTFPTFCLFGFSGGGQFAHRYALVRPERVAALAVAAAGWYTWPSSDQRFPRGLRPSRARADLRCDIDRFLTIPTCVLVGALDTRRESSLRQSPRLDAQQGRTRLERARNWHNALIHERSRRGISAQHELKVLASSDHDFLGSVRQDGLDRHLFDFFSAATSKSQRILNQWSAKENKS
jgi:pimeloyl-ACP methyl ester carboxylesterase